MSFSFHTHTCPHKVSESGKPDTLQERRRHARGLFQQEALDVLRRLRERQPPVGLAGHTRQPPTTETWAMQQLHSLKGSAAMLDFAELATAIHELESGFLARWPNEADWVRSVVALEHHLLKATAGSGRSPCESPALSPDPDALQRSSSPGGDADSRQLYALLAHSGADISALDDLIDVLDNSGLTAERSRAVRRMRSVRTRLARLNEAAIDALLAQRCRPIDELCPILEAVLAAAAEAGRKQIAFGFHCAGQAIDEQHFVMVRTALEHLARNAAVHGIESPQERVRNGKPPCGRVTLTGSRHADYVVLRLEDDGGGIMPAGRSTALATEPTAVMQALADEQIEQLTRAGFTTHTPPDQYAGRGFGLAIVRQLIEALDGYLQIDSGLGMGTAVSIGIPLSADTPREVFVFEQARRLYALPVENVREARHRPVALPHERRAGFELLIDREGRRLRLSADSLIGIRHVVFGALGPQLDRLGRIAGGGVLANGRQVLMLDPAWLLQYPRA